jgi:hypothetical protein
VSIAARRSAARFDRTMLLGLAENPACFAYVPVLDETWR